MAAHVRAAYDSNDDELEEQLDYSYEVLDELVRRGDAETLAGLVKTAAQPGFGHL